MANNQSRSGQIANYNATKGTRTDGDTSGLEVDQTGNLLTSNGTLSSGEDRTNDVQGVQHKPAVSPIYSGTPGIAAYNDVDILVKATSGQLLSIACNNKNAAERFLWIKNKATVIAGSDTVTAGTDLVFPVPLSTTGLVDFTNFLKQHGQYFSLGITIGVSTSATSFTAATTTDHYIIYEWI